MISAESSPAAAPKSKSAARPAAAGARAGAGTPPFTALADAGLVLLFLALTFLLGAFPLKDTDLFWHLRTGQIIRESGEVPRFDLFTYTREKAPWIDLHWIFQIAVSWLYERGGAVALNLAKCVVTCVAVLILVTCRRREWPIWAIARRVAPRAPGPGRPDVRPARDALATVSVDLLRGADALGSPSVCWSRSYRSSRSPGSTRTACSCSGRSSSSWRCSTPRSGPARWPRRPGRWWRIAGIGSLATFAACLVNPYGLRGAVYPIELAGTMTNTVFSHNIAELTPIPEFIRRAGLGNLPLQLHFLTMALGALSFLVPLVWLIVTWFSGPPTTRPAGAVIDPAAAPPRSPRGREGAGRRAIEGRAEEGRGMCSKGDRSGGRAGSGVVAAEPVPPAALRRVQLPEPPGHAEQPPVRGGGRVGHGLELRRMGRGDPAAAGRTPGPGGRTARHLGRPGCHGWRSPGRPSRCWPGSARECSTA